MKYEMKPEILLPCSYRLRIESMLLRAEFEANMSFLEPSMEAMLSASEGMKHDFLPT